MTDPHLTPEHEAEIRADLARGVAHPTWTMVIRNLLAALDAEREAHSQTRTALEASTELLAQLVTRMPGLHWRIQIDERVQANQRVLGLAVAEADKPHDGNER